MTTANRAIAAAAAKSPMRQFQPMRIRITRRRSPFNSSVNYKQTTQRTVSDPTGQPAGTLTINTKERKLYYSLGDGHAVQYGIAVGKAGFAWKGEATVGRKSFWPGWTPPPEMIERRPELPEHMDGSLSNPLGARALYLFQGNKDTLFRIHGTNEPSSIGHAASSGCIRMDERRRDRPLWPRVQGRACRGDVEPAAIPSGFPLGMPSPPIWSHSTLADVAKGLIAIRRDALDSLLASLNRIGKKSPGLRCNLRRICLLAMTNSRRPPSLPRPGAPFDQNIR